MQRWELTWAEVLSTVFHPSLNYFHLLCLYIHEWRGCPNYTFLLPLAWFIAFHHPILPSINMVPMISMPRDVQYMFVKKRSLVLDQYLVWADLSWGIGMELFHDLSWKEKHRWNKFRSLWAIKCPSKPWQRANLLRYQTPGFSSPEWNPVVYCYQLHLWFSCYDKPEGLLRKRSTREEKLGLVHPWYELLSLKLTEVLSPFI